MSIEDNAVEQITVNPDQTAQVVKNEDKFQDTAQLNVAVFDPSVVTQKTNKSLDDLTDWKEYLHDPWKAMESGEARFEKYKPVGDLSRDPVWYSLTQKYGRDIVDKTDVLLEYKDSRNMFGRIIGGYEYASDGLKLADARKRLSDAVTAGNMLQAKQIENEIAELKYKLANRDRPFESEGWNSLMSVSASYARNLPEVVMVNLAGAAAAAPTGGWSVPAARVATAGIIYNDTYNLEYGSILHDIMTTVPGISEAEARERAGRAANVNALIESLPSLIPGGDVLAGAGRRVGEAALKKGGGVGLKEGLKLLVQRNPEAAKQLLVNAAKLLGKWGVEITSESLQELFQDMMGEAAVESAETGRDFGEVSQERLLSFVRDPFSEENADLWETFGYTAGGVGAFEIATGLLTRGAGVAGRAVRKTLNRGPSNTEQRAVGATANRTLAERLFQHRQNSEVAQQSPELTDRANQAMVDRQAAPQKVYLDKDMVEQLLKDNGVQEAMEKLGVPEAYEESKSNGGLIEVDFTKYDSVVNTDEALFQRIKNAVSFSPETLSLNQFQAYVDSLDKKSMGEIERARQNTESVYNRFYNTMLQLHNDEKLAQAQAIQAQMIANRIGAFRLGGARTGEDIASRLEIRIPGQQPEVMDTQKVEQMPIDTTAFREAYANNKKEIDRGIAIPFNDENGTEVVISKGEGYKGTWSVVLKDKTGRARILTNDGQFVDIGVGATKLPTNIMELTDESRALIAAEDAVSREMDKYDADTIVVDGVERTVYNSNGERISASKQSLTNFWRWFGDSKVVDERGRPTVVYHGGPAGIESFDINKASADARYGKAFYFARKKEDADFHMGIRTANKGETRAYYLKIENPAYVDDRVAADTQAQAEVGPDNVAKVVERAQEIIREKHDGIVNVYRSDSVADATEFAVFDSKNVKRTDNLGTWSPEDERLLHQRITYRGESRDMFNDVFTRDGKQIKYAELDNKYNTGVNREAITDDTNIKIVRMPPQDFLALTPWRMGSEDVSDLEEVINKGEGIPMPFLTVKVEDPKKKTLRVVGHEGRHRSLAMMKLGASNGYVILDSKDFYRQPELFKDGIAGWRILPQKGAAYEDETYYDIDEGDARDERVLRQFVGGGAKLKDAAPELYDRYKKAQQMMFQGKDDDEIFKETHIHIAPDGSLRIQISDKDAKVLPAMKTQLGWKPKEKKYTMRRSTKLGEVFSHPFLFDLYPWLKDIEVSISKTTQEYTKKYRENGVVTRMEHFIEIKNDEPDSRLRQSFLHEIQHAIQDHEGWAQGGKVGSSRHYPTSEESVALTKRRELLKSIFETLHKNKVLTYWDASDSRVPTYRTLEPEESRSLGQVMSDIAKDDPEFAKQLAELKELNKQLENYDERDPRMKYFQLFGEAEARLTEKLSYMSQEELDKLDPYQYFDVTQARVKRGRSDRGFWVSLPENQQKVGEFDVELGFDEPDNVGDTGQTGGTIAGTFFREGDKLVIQLSPDANPTTLTHELFHWFSYEMQQAYNSGEMTDYWKEKTEALARMVDAKFEVDPVDPNVKRLFLTSTQEEKAADMFLEYIREGKVKNDAVKPLFAYMQTLFKSVFNLLGLRQLKLNKDSEELFGAIFRAQDVIEDEQRLAGILAIEKPEGADQGLYDMYIGEMLNSRVRGTQELYKKWFAIDKFRKSEEYEKLRNDTRLDVADELNQELRYIVVDEAAQHGNDPQATWFALQTNPETADLQLSVQEVQEILENTPDKTTEIDRITNERMDAYIQQRFKITPEEMGLKASRNSSKVKALLAESLMRDGKTIQDFDAAYADLLATADNQVAKSSLHRLADKEYWNTLEARAVERYAFALANNDNKVMTETRRDQAIVNAIRMRAEAITNKARRFQEVAESFRGAQKKIVVKDPVTGKKHGEYKYGAYDYDLLQSMLEKFGFEINYARRRPLPVAQKLDNWITEQEATTLTRAGELRNFIPFIEKGHEGTFTSMTGADFEKLDSVFNAVKSVAGARYAIVLENERVLLSQMVDETKQHFKDLGIEAFDKKDGYWAKHFGTIATWTNPEPVVRALFTRKTLDNVWLPFIDAAAQAERYGSQWIDRYRVAKSKVDLSNKSTTYSTGQRLSNQQVADLLLSMGNEHAYENFRKSLGIDEQQAETIVSEALIAQPALADFAKEVWATYGDATTILDKEFEERTNTLFVEKSHREFEINGIKFGGGYVPVRKRLDYVPTDVRGGNQGGMVHDKKFEKLVVAQADGNMLSIVDITEHELFQSAKQGFTAVQYNNARKLLLADGMRQVIGERAFSFLDGWLTSYMLPKYDTTAWVRPLATLSSVGALGFRVSTAFLQLSGLVPAAIAVGPKYFARGIHMAMKNGEWAPVMATRRGARKSDYMAVRIGDPRSSLLGQSIVDAVRAEDANTKLGKTAKFLMSKVGNAAMWGIQQIDTMVANVTWNGAYLKALDSGLSEIEARREADSIVRMVQSDSMQISRSQGLQSQYARMFTAFATWIMAMQSQLRASLATRQYGNAIVWAAAYMFLSPIFESFLKEATRIGGGDDDDKDYIERVIKTCYNEIFSTVGTSVIPPAQLGGAFLVGLLSGIEEGITGEREIFETRQANVPALQTAYRAINAVRYAGAAAISGDEESLGKAATYAASTVSTEVGRLVKYLLAE